MFVKPFVKCRRALEEPRLGGHQSGYVSVVLLEQSLRGFDIAGTSRPQRELHTRVHHLLLERRLVVGRPTAGAAAPYLLRAVRLGVLVPLRERLLAQVPFACRTLRRLAI